MTSLELAQSPWRRRFAAVDRVWLAFGLLFLALAAASPDQAWESGVFVVDAVMATGAYLLLAVLIAAYAKASGADALIARVFRGNMAGMTVLAALFGALSPFCSCGVIPLIAALLAMGVPLPPVMAFWLASPIMDPSMFVLTAGTLGTEFAVAKTVAAIAMGLFGGFGALAMMRLGLITGVLREGVGDGGCAGSKMRAPKPILWPFWREPARRSTFVGETRSVLLFLGKWLALAFLLESLMLAYVPAEWIASALGGDGIWVTLLAVVTGVPAYLNGYAALPLVGGLIEGGMNPGAGMAFLVAGGVTSIPAAIAVFALARPRVCAAYIGFALVGSVTAGLAYGALA